MRQTGLTDTCGYFLAENMTDYCSILSLLYCSGYSWPTGTNLYMYGCNTLFVNDFTCVVTVGVTGGHKTMTDTKICEEKCKLNHKKQLQVKFDSLCYLFIIRPLKIIHHSTNKFYDKLSYLNNTSIKSIL